MLGFPLIHRATVFFFSDETKSSEKGSKNYEANMVVVMNFYERRVDVLVGAYSACVSVLVDNHCKNLVRFMLIYMDGLKLVIV